MGLEILSVHLVINPSCRYTAWIFVAALYHLPSFQSMGVDLRMNLSLFLTIFVSSILFLLVFHIIFLGLWYIGLVARVAGKRPEILTILQNCAVSFSFDFYLYIFFITCFFFFRSNCLPLNVYLGCSDGMSIITGSKYSVLCIL